MGTICTVDGCQNFAVARGWCPKHWMRWRHQGSPDSPTVFDLTPEDRFWRKVDKTAGCWLWTAGLRGDGYGAFRSPDGKQIGAHRYSYQLHHGRIPEGMVVMHSCDEPLCVNPAHLSLGTVADNAADASRKGRRLPGSQNHQAKLTEEQVREIRERYASGGITHAALATEYAISVSLVGHILARRAWKHI